MLRKSLIISVFAFCFAVACEKDVACDANNTNRVGAVCNDGTTSNATGSGACSSHGGVDYWLCEE